VTDAAVIQKYYLERYQAQSVMIAYGTRCERLNTTEVLDRLRVRPRDYVLYVSRLEPENNAHIVIEAFATVRSQMPLLIVGDAPYAQDYIASLKRTSDPRVRFTGGIYGTGYQELQSHAAIYIHATEVGGTHPALIEAMGAGNCVLVYDTPENREVIGDCGLVFKDAADLSRLIQLTIEEPNLVAKLRDRAQARARALYSWDAVTDKYEKLFRDMKQSS